MKGSGHRLTPTGYRAGSSSSTPTWDDIWFNQDRRKQEEKGFHRPSDKFLEKMIVCGNPCAQALARELQIMRKEVEKAARDALEATKCPAPPVLEGWESVAMLKINAVLKFALQSLDTLEES